MDKMTKENMIKVLVIGLVILLIGFYSGRLYERSRTRNVRESFMQRNGNITRETDGTQERMPNGNQNAPKMDINIRGN